MISGTQAASDEILPLLNKFRKISKFIKLSMLECVKAAGRVPKILMTIWGL